MPNDDTQKIVEFRVIAEDGFNYNGKLWPMGAELQLPEDKINLIKHYFDDHTLEIPTPVKSVDTMKTVEVVSLAVDKTLEILMKKYPRSDPQSFSVHDRINDSDEFQKTGGFKGVADYAISVYKMQTNQPIDDKMKAWLGAEKAATGMGEAIDSEGGILAPTKFRDQLLMPPVETAVIRPRAQQVPIETNSVSIPSIEVSSHASHRFGGVLAYWVDEGTAATDTKPKFGKVTLTLHKLIALAYVTSELLDDSIISLEALLPGMFQTAITYQEDDSFINGTGAGSPLGLLNSPCKVAVAIETGQPADTVVTKNILKMWSRLYTAGKRNAIWLVSPDVMPQLYQLELAVGTGGSSAGLLREQNVQGEPVTTMLGRPVIESEKVPVVGDAGDVVLTDLTQYLIGNKAGNAPGTFNSSIHLNFNQDETAFRITLRTDGQSWWKSAITPKNGGATVSPIVTIAERA